MASWQSDVRPISALSFDFRRFDIKGWNSHVHRGFDFPEVLGQQIFVGIIVGIIVCAPRRGGASHEQISEFRNHGLCECGTHEYPQNHHDLHPLPVGGESRLVACWTCVCFVVGVALVVFPYAIMLVLFNIGVFMRTPHSGGVTRAIASSRYLFEIELRI